MSIMSIISTSVTEVKTEIKEDTKDLKNKKISIIYGCFRENKCCYVGQHNTDDLKRRIKKHKGAYKDFIKKNNIQDDKHERVAPLNSRHSNGCPALYRAFHKYGFDAFEWQILDTTTNRETINALEDEYIKKYDTMSPNGYNLRLNGTDNGTATYCSEETRKRLSESVRKHTTINYTKYRKYVKELEGMPQYVHYRVMDNGTRKYSLKGHPTYPYHQFSSSVLSNDELKKQMLDHLEKCKNGTYVQKTKDLPKGIRCNDQVGTYQARISHKGIRYCKNFSDNSSEENLKNAVSWLKKMEESFKDPNFNGVPIENPRYEHLKEIQESILLLIEEFKTIFA